VPIIKYKNKDGERVPSVTTVLGQWGEGAKGLQYWYWKKGQDGIDFNEMPEAQVGTVAHEMCDADAKGKKFDASVYPIEYVEQAQKCFENWLEWKKAYKPKIIETEVSLISEKHQFGGTIDCVFQANDKLCILDLKTGKEVYASQVVQIESYKVLWNENFPDHPITGGSHIIRTGKEMASFVHYHYGDFPQAV